MAIAVFLLIGSLLAVWGFLIEPNRLIVNHYELKLKKWSPQLNGFKIVAISDIHAGSNFINEEKIRRIVAEANAQNPDLIVLLGDYVAPVFYDRRKLKMPMSVVAENLRELRAKYGVFAVLGNTDEAFGTEEVRSELGKVGIKVLSNERATVNVNGETLCLLGMKDKMISGDWQFISGALKKVLAGENSNEKILVLVYNPDYLRVITGGFSISDNISLVLAGHTHGGQVRFPSVGAPVVPSEYGQKYAAGYIRDAETDMFVTTGIGTSIIPVRFGVPPEIAILTLCAE